jgi:hypothetical protein
VDLVGTITTPGGKAVPVRAFYVEDFAYDAARYGQQLVLPQGMPRFALRYTPLEEGEHLLRLAGTLGGEPFALPDQRFTVQPSLLPWRGYVRPSPHDPRLLAYSVGDEEFWGLGMNVRSPDDTRYVASFPFTAWDYQDLDIYEKLLPQYAANGIKVIEVWMSPWWLALEWIPDAPGNHGIGEMNQWRAWKLDRLLRRCEELDLYLVLVLNNHGKFSAWIDSDWERSPFNRQNGGPLDTPMEYFSLPVARQAYARLADYLVARWGYSSHLLAWKLFTEIDLTGNNREWYKEPAVKEWHAFAGDYLKRIDPNQHLVTTHWATSYEMVNRDLALIPQLDMLTLDIYYQGSGAEHFFDYLLATSDFLDGMGKPGIITEFGGSPHGDTLPHILHQLHLALWGGFFTRFPVSPCFWWFPLVEEQNLYHEYAAVARFAEGEHRAGSRAYHKRLDEQLFLFELRQPQTRHYWLVDTSYYFSGSLTLRPPLHHSRTIRLTDLPAGTWAAEFWDCRTGTRMGQAEVIATPGAAPELRLPPFEADVAIKLKATSLPPSPGP